MPEVVFAAISDVTHPDFAAAMTIYENAFIPAERHPLPQLTERVASGKNLLQVGYIQGRVVFLALFWPLINTDFILLDYMATLPEYRNRGIGAAFMLRQRGELIRNSQHLVLEVEAPDSGENRVERQRRILFYKRIGACIINGVRYLLPPLHGDTPTEMRLMFFPAQRGETMSAKTLRVLITKLYQELYGRGNDDPLLTSVLDEMNPQQQLFELE
jgi:GNAT superfamily N-acetyltransferase